MVGVRGALGRQRRARSWEAKGRKGMGVPWEVQNESGDERGDTKETNIATEGAAGQVCSLGCSGDVGKDALGNETHPAEKHWECGSHGGDALV